MGDWEAYGNLEQFMEARSLRVANERIILCRREQNFKLNRAGINQRLKRCEQIHSSDLAEVT